MSARVILADDHEMFLDGLRDLIARENDMEVVALVPTGEAVVEYVRSRPADVVVLDVTMPGMGGIETTRILRRERPGLRVLALSMHADRHIIAGMLAAGARGYVLKESSSAEFLIALRTVLKGEIALCPRVASIVTADYLDLLGRAAPEPECGLSPRELEVLRLLVDGRSARDISSSLHISRNTVDTHRRNILEKTGCDNLADLTRFALREGLAGPDR
jgi:DNA-binding NarL/FixJ family response regulator